MNPPPRRAPRRLAAWFAAVLLAALTAACGGGDLVSQFSPRRIVAFGDETSALTATGQNWGINALDATTGAPLCQNNPNWVQYLAQSFKLPFPQCNPGDVAAPSIDNAAAGAKVADLVTQVDAHLASDDFSGSNLVTVLVGANDVIEQYLLYDGTNEATLTATLEQRGALIAGQVNRIVAAGGKVIVSTVPAVGLTPFALAEKAAHTDTDRAALLSRLTGRLNAALRVGLLNDSGRDVGLVLGDEVIQFYVNFPAAGTFVNVTDAACTTAPPQCTTATLDTAKSANALTWFWSDATNLAPGPQRQLGLAADRRARNNPF